MFYKNNFHKKIVVFLSLFSFVFLMFGLFPNLGDASGRPEFNTHENDRKTLRVGNRTQSTGWESSISADPGDGVSFNVYYHNNVQDTVAKNTKIRIDYPCSADSTITPRAYIWADNADKISDTATINISGSPDQKLEFNDVALWYPDQGTQSQDITVERVGSCSVQVDIGDIKGCWPWQGHVLFNANLVDDEPKEEPEGELDCHSSTENSIRLSYDFVDGSNVSIFRGNTRLTVLGSGDDSGTYRDTGLSPDTSYTYYLRDGTSTSSERLDRVVCKTKEEDDDSWGELDCHSSTENSIRLSYDFVDGSNVSIFRGNTRLTVLGSGDDSGTYRDTGLSPDTSYTYYLRDGTSTSSERLDRVVCKTRKEDKEEEDLDIEKSVKSLERDTTYSNSLDASPGELISYRIRVYANNADAKDVVLKDSAPDRISFDGNLKLDGSSVSGDIRDGIDIGDISKGDYKTVTFDARIAPRDEFLIATTSMTNVARATSENDSVTDKATVHVKREDPKEPPTTAPTGITGNPTMDYVVLPFLLALIVFILFRKHFIALGRRIESVRKDFRAQW